MYPRKINTIIVDNGCLLESFIKIRTTKLIANNISEQTIQQPLFSGSIIEDNNNKTIGIRDKTNRIGFLLIISLILSEYNISA